MNRGTQPAAARPAPSGGAPVSGGRGKDWKSARWLRILTVVLLFALTGLGVALLTLMYVGTSREGDLVQNKHEQAIFLTNGQVYFGKIQSITKQYVDIAGIYYLNVSQQVQPDQKGSNANQSNSVSLVKLGCELHGPMDRMVINRDQVTFWENLKDDGQVTKAIATWVKQNPNGQQCTQPNTSSGTNSTTGTNP